MSGPIGNWQVRYAAGRWIVVAGPTSLVVLDDPGSSELVEALWTDVVASASMVDLAERLATYRPETVPHLGAFFWSASGMRSLLRGEVAVIDAQTGDMVADGSDMVTWTEVGLGDLQTVDVALGSATELGDGASTPLPLVIGVVGASRLRLDARTESLLISPQIEPTPVEDADTEVDSAVLVSMVNAAEAEAEPEQEVGEEVQWGWSADDHGGEPTEPMDPAEFSVRTRPAVVEDANPSATDDGMAEQPAEDESESARGAETPDDAEFGDESADAGSLGIEASEAEAAQQVNDNADTELMVLPPEGFAAGPAAAPVAAVGLGGYGGIAPAPVPTPISPSTAAPPSPPMPSPPTQAQSVPIAGPPNYQAAPSYPAPSPQAAPQQPPYVPQQQPAHPPTAPVRSDSLIMAALCAMGHSNPPNSSVCRLCGGGIAPQNPRLVTRPLIARVRGSDGSAVDVDRTVLVGRAPSASRSTATSPHLLALPSPAHDISRTHLQISPEGWQIVVTDLHSTNGTIMIRAGGMERSPLRPGEPIAVPLGTILELGDGVSVLIDRPQ